MPGFPAAVADFICRRIDNGGILCLPEHDPQALAGQIKRFGRSLRRKKLTSKPL